MKADTFYFSHDYNPRQDPKIKRLLVKHGMTGYGIFWAIVEDLYNNANALPTDYECIAFDLRSDCELIKSVITGFDLFEIKDGVFGSLSVQRRLDDRDKKSVKARESARKRWDNDANAMRTHSDGNANLPKSDAIKEKKGKEKKGKEKNTTSAAPATAPDIFSEKFDLFCQHKKFSIEPPGVKRNTGLKKIREFFLAQVPPGAENSEHVAFEMWYTVLKRFDQWEPFYQKQIQLIQIANNLPNIIATINGAGSKNQHANDGGQLAAEAMAAVIRRHQNGTSGVTHSHATEGAVS